MTSGGTVPSEVIAQLLENAMHENGWADSKFLVDGYPRSVEQLKGWGVTLSKKIRFLFCLSLEVSEEEMTNRLMARAKTSGRVDDNPETIAKRFVTYQKETGPLLDHFKGEGTLKIVDGGQTVAKVWADVREICTKALA